MLDCIIIGSGPAGLSAALNLKTYNKEFIWFGSKTMSDKVKKAERISNYPGFPSISGAELLASFQQHAEAAGLTITEKTVTTILHGKKGWMVLADNEMYEARSIILCTGVMSARVLKEEDRLLGSGVSYCATCDGMFYKGKKIAVISNAKKFEHEVEFLASLAKEVIFYPSYQDVSVSAPNIIISAEVPVAINGTMRAESLTTKSGETVPVDGIFCLRDAIAPARLIPGLTVEGGHITVDRTMATNLDGCFAAGDCTGRPYQYTKAVGEGNTAAHSAIAYLAGLEHARG